MSDRWERVTALFTAARVLEPKDRQSFLDIACIGEDVLRAEVEALLAADVADDSFLQTPPWEMSDDSFVTTLDSGQVLKDRYRVEEQIAAGGQALVYRAMDQKLSRPVVIKVMRTEGRRNQWLKSRFEQEMRALASIDHPGVVGILDVGELEDSSPFLVLHYIPGQSLREALARGAMAPTRVAAILQQMASALHAAHAAGIAHRDLKPENVMLQPRDGGEDAVKLIDFGIAKIDRNGLEPQTTTVMIAGTVRYMAPEQFEGRHSTASDIYSLALIVCEMLGGAPDIRALPRAIPATARAALQAALAYQPEKRPANVQKWSKELARGLTSATTRKVRVAAVALAATLVVGSAVAQQWFFTGRGEPVRVIQKVGPFDPLTEGFKVAHDVTGRIVQNAERDGYEAWRLVTRGQGYYYVPFTAAQKRRALERGWKLSAVLRVEAGAGGVVADFGGEKRRFDVAVLREGSREIVRLQTQIVPDIRGLDFIQEPAGEYHEYELTYDPLLKSTELWVDKKRRLTGYVGHNQFQEDRGLLLYGMAYRSDSGSTDFKSARFELIH